MRATRFFLCVVAASSLLVLDAPAARAPSDTELRAAYCLGALAALKASTRQAMSKLNQKDDQERRAYNIDAKVLSENEDRLDRLQLYLTAKTDLDPTFVMATMNRGETDYKRWAANTSTCTSACPAATMSEMKACNQRCFSGDLHEHIQACTNLSWLPF